MSDAPLPGPDARGEDTELAERAHELSREGSTYADIAKRFSDVRTGGRAWTRGDVEQLMRLHPVDPTAAPVDVAARRERDEAERRERAFRRSPQGQARSAFEQGDEVFQVDFPLLEAKAHVLIMTAAFSTSQSNDVTTVLNGIVREGWELLTASMVFHETGSQSRDKFLASGQQIAVSGDVIGYYVFKRCETNRVGSQ
jgi:hypothetical protein